MSEKRNSDSTGKKKDKLRFKKYKGAEEISFQRKFRNGNGYRQIKVLSIPYGQKPTKPQGDSPEANKS